MPELAFFRHGEELLRVVQGDQTTIGRSADCMNEMARRLTEEPITAVGGLGRVVNKGDVVWVKPNFGWDRTPEQAANTHPEVVKAIIRLCMEAGAKAVKVGDNTCNDAPKCYKNSGIESAVKDAGGKIAPGHTEGYYHEVSVPNGKVLKKAKEHEQVLGADVFINVPVLKHHSSSRVTIGLKNLMGNVWDRGFWHGNDLHQCIADFGTFRKPTLNVIDAYYVMKRNGPRGVSVEDVVTTCSNAGARMPPLFSRTKPNTNPPKTVQNPHARITSVLMPRIQRKTPTCIKPNNPAAMIAPQPKGTPKNR